MRSPPPCFDVSASGAPLVIDVSLLGTAFWVMAPDPIVNRGRTRDGRRLFLNVLQPDRYWPDLCRHLGRPELIDLGLGWEEIAAAKDAGAIG
jgi:hypothetical protein